MPFPPMNSAAYVLPPLPLHPPIASSTRPSLAPGAVVHPAGLRTGHAQGSRLQRASVAGLVVVAHLAGLVTLAQLAMRPVIIPELTTISLALIPAMAAREVAVSSLATSYAVAATDEEGQALALGDRLKADWSLPTALAFLAWFVFAPQCMSTIAVTRRETNGWKWPIVMLLYLFGLAYVFAGITYWSAVALGL